MATLPLNVSYGYGNSLGGSGYGAQGTQAVTNQGLGYGSWPFDAIYTASSSNTGNNIFIWYQWNQQYQMQTPSVTYQEYNNAPAYDAETVARIERERIASMEAIQARARQLQEAEQKALELLFLFLTPEQQEDYKTRGWF